MTFQELEPQLLALSNTEKAQVIELLSKDLSFPDQGIEKNPEVCGGSACITNTRITIWGLVEAKQMGYSEADLLTSHPTLTAKDLANAWAYAHKHQQEIDYEIRSNNSAIEEAH